MTNLIKNAAASLNQAESSFTESLMILPNGLPNLKPAVA